MLFAILIPVLALRSLPAAKNSINNNDPLELCSGIGSPTASNSSRSRPRKKSMILR